MVGEGLERSQDSNFGLRPPASPCPSAIGFASGDYRAGSHGGRGFRIWKNRSQKSKPRIQESEFRIQEPGARRKNPRARLQLAADSMQRAGILDCDSLYSKSEIPNSNCFLWLLTTSLGVVPGKPFNLDPGNAGQAWPIENPAGRGRTRFPRF